SGSITAILPVDTIKAICKRYNADLLLTHDSAEIYFDWETTRDPDDRSNKTKDFYLWTNFYVSLYSSGGELINRSKLEKGTFYESRPALSALITFKPSLAKAAGVVESLAYDAGTEYVKKFYPETVEESRMLYSGKDFAESNKSIELKNWDKAIELLEQLSASPKRSIAAKARHNLEIVKEIKATGSRGQDRTIDQLKLIQPANRLR
ncbi:MAG: DUF6340 family protein, partial [Bacteroidales bacterium]